MARKSWITLKHYIHNEAGSLYDQGKAIVEYYLPGVKLEMTLFGTHSFWIPLYNLIIWTIGDSALCLLLHEVGHAKLHKRVFEFDYNPWRDYIEEFEAWIWAEQACKKLGIWFDYYYAHQTLGLYRKKLKMRNRSVCPMWRYYDKSEKDRELAEKQKTRKMHKMR